MYLLFNRARKSQLALPARERASSLRTARPPEADTVTNTLILRFGADDFEQRDGVQYAEDALRSRDNEYGVAIQYADGETDFEIGARIAGVYPEGEFEPLDDEYEALVDQVPTV